MSVILLAQSGAAVRRTVQALAAQTAVGRLELVLVTASQASLPPDRELLDAFAGHQVVEVGPVRSTAAARAEGIRAARAPIVALAEDHCFPEPGWAAALIEAHEAGWAAVGPEIANANPRTMLSWANLALEYGPWMAPEASGERDHLPGHNSSYRRELLLAYGDRLEEMLEAESILQWDLRERGHRLYQERRARTRHLNPSLLRPSLILRWHGGRLFAAARSRRWSPLRRLLFTLASPAIPLVRTARVVRLLRERDELRHLFPRILPALAIVTTVDGLGEIRGYAFGLGDAIERTTEFEFERAAKLTPEDRAEQDSDRAGEPVRVGV